MVLQKMTVEDLYCFVVDKVQLKIYRCAEDELFLSRRDVEVLNEPCDIVDLPDRLQKMQVIGLFPEKVGCLTIRVAPEEPELPFRGGDGIMVTIKDFYDQNEDIRDEVIIAIQEQLPFPETLWEGKLSEVPEKFYPCEVVETGKSLKAAEEGITKYYLYISKAPKEEPEDEKPGCFYTLCYWDPESEDEVPVMFNIGAWLTVQAAMLEQYEGYSMDYIVELRPDSIWIYNSGDDSSRGFAVNFTVEHSWEYCNNGIIRLDLDTDLVFRIDEKNKLIKFDFIRHTTFPLPFSDEEVTE